MKKILTLLILTVVAATFVGCDFYGTTTTEPPVTRETRTIATVADLVAMNTTDHYLLDADLDLEGVEWIPIGTPDDPFTGDFDGQGHIISDFKVTQPNAGFAGLFGMVTGDISDLRLADVVIDVDADQLFYAGLLVGHTLGSISGCSVGGTVTVANASSNTFAGLLAGFASSYTTATMTLEEFVPAAIVESHATGTLTVTTKNFLFVGGLVGKTYNVILTDDSADVAIDAAASAYRLYAGGLVGHNYGGLLKPHADVVEDAIFETVRCYADALITVRSEGTQASVGGLFGFNQEAYVEDCFARADMIVTGGTVHVGGLIGELWFGSVASSTARFDLVGTITEPLVGRVAGFVRDGTVVTNVPVLATTAFALANTVGGTAIAADFGNLAWYGDTLGWTGATFDLPTVLGILS